MNLSLDDFEAVAFDFDGTLANSYPVHAATRIRAFGELGYGHITPEEHALGHTYGASIHTIIGGILKAAGNIEPSADPDTDERIQKIVRLKKDYFHEQAEQGLEAFPGAIEFVRHIARSYHGRMAIVTTGHLLEVSRIVRVG
jgi:beta-phosphoglucomutase-like phosphatase (HAD superfamily)